MSILTARSLRSTASAWLAAVVLALASLAARADDLVAVPPLRSPVTDLTSTLAPDQVASLEARLRAFEQEKGSQVAVLIVPTTAPEDIEQFSIRVADAWKLGRKGVDDGAILLVARDDRRVRIEVGYGLEGVLPDATANRIIEEDIVPRFRGDDYYGGITAGVDRMLRVIQGEPLPAPERRSPARGAPGLFNLLPLLLVVALVGGSVLRRMFGRLGGALAAGGLVGFATWLILGILALAVLAGFIAFVFAALGGGPGGRGWHSGRHGRGGGGFGGGWGGGLGGGGGFGGSWGGGGGGFGGGGASGRW